MNNMWLSAWTGLLFFVSALYASPLDHKTDVIVTGEDEIVYVFNMYAVRGVKSEVLGRMLSHHTLSKMPQMFEPVGSILMSTDHTEPVDMGDLSDYLEISGLTVDRMDDENHPTVIEIKFEYDIVDYMFDTVETQMYLLHEGIIMNVSKEDDQFIINIELDESVKNIHDHSLRLEALVNAFEDHGYPIEYVRNSGRVVSLKITLNQLLDRSDEESEEFQTTTTTTRNNIKEVETKSERRLETNNGNEVEIGHDKKMQNKIEDIDDLDIPLDFITRSDSSNKIRKRRSACPECKAGNLIRQYLNNYPALH